MRMDHCAASGLSRRNPRRLTTFGDFLLIAKSRYAVSTGMPVLKAARVGRNVSSASRESAQTGLAQFA